MIDISQSFLDNLLRYDDEDEDEDCHLHLHLRVLSN